MKKLSTLLPLLFVGLSSMCYADELPNLKLGQWEITTHMKQLANPMKITSCVSEESKKKILEMSQQGHGHCEKAETSHSGNTWTTKTRCDYQGTPVTMTMVMTMENETSYSSVVTSDNPTHPMSIKSEGVYKGECVNKQTEVEVAPGIKFDPKKFADIAKSLNKNPR